VVEGPIIGAAIYDRVCGITPAFCWRVHLNRIALADVCFFELRKMRLNAHILSVFGICLRLRFGRMSLSYLKLKGLQIEWGTQYNEILLCHSSFFCDNLSTEYLERRLCLTILLGS
jgi:hypothetical protein